MQEFSSWITCILYVAGIELSAAVNTVECCCGWMKGSGVSNVMYLASLETVQRTLSEEFISTHGVVSTSTVVAC